MKANGAATKRAAVEAGLRMLVKSHKQQGIRMLFGKIEWEGDLETARTSEKWKGSPITWKEDTALPDTHETLSGTTRGNGKKAALRLSTRLSG